MIHDLRIDTFEKSIPVRFLYPARGLLAFPLLP